MLSRHEFHAALTLALAALSPPSPDEAPIVGTGKPGLDNVCFDFWPGDSLRIVGTNGRRLVVVFATVPGLPKAGKFLMPLASTQEALQLFAPYATDGLPGMPESPRVSFVLFGLEQMIITSGDDVQMVVGAPGTLYPEYSIMMQDHSGTDLTKGAVFDMGTLAWVLEHAPIVGTEALAVSLRGYSVSTFRPKLREEFQAIRDVAFCIKPLAVTT